MRHKKGLTTRLEHASTSVFECLGYEKVIVYMEKYKMLGWCVFKTMVFGTVIHGLATET